MLYRKFGKTGIDVSVLGFGCMRFPVVDKEQNKIDEPKALEMLEYSLEQGVNYFDTAYPYHGGNSEPLVGKFLQGKAREELLIATKMPVYKVEKYADFMDILDEQLGKLQTDYVDFYLLHALNKNSWEKSKDNDVFRFIDEAKKQGKIRHIGFSFHDQLPVFKQIIDEYDKWEFCQIQLNYMNEFYQAGMEGMRYAADKGLPIVIMEPLLGGKLTKNITPDLQAIWDQSEEKRSPAEWAFRWLLNMPEATTILSGMSTMDQVKENIEIVSRTDANCLTRQDREIIAQARDYYEQRTAVNCTLCQYCMPCPAGVKIPSIFNLYNNAAMYDSHESASRWYQQMIENNVDASQCIDCEQCEKACPQNLEVRRHLREFHEKYAGEKPEKTLSNDYPQR